MIHALRHFVLVAVCLSGAAAQAEPASPAERQLGTEIFRQLIGINTTDSVGNVTVAAEAMAQRLRDGGFAAGDIQVLGPDPRKANLVVRYRGRAGGRLKPILIIGHLDVVEARREDWATDPFTLVEKDGYFYGRGTYDMKVDDAILVTDFLRLRKAGYVPDRDLILALTADEEAGRFNGLSWLIQNHRELIDAEYVLNPDGGYIKTQGGKPIAIEVSATEKLYADFQLVATNPGGHSSRPTADNAIYHVTDALARLEKTPFPVELNAVTRAYFEKLALVESGPVAADMRAILATPPDPDALARLSRDPAYNATLRTTCVATLLAGGHASNALPVHAEANVNCRILPGHSQEEIRLQLVKLFDDPALSIRYRSDAGELSEHASDRRAMAPPPLRPDLLAALGRIAARHWPGTPIIPIMETVASDGIYAIQAGIPTYGVCPVLIERDDIRQHARDERIPVSSFYTGLDVYDELLRLLTGGAP